MIGLALGLFAVISAIGAGQHLLSDAARKSPTAWAHALGGGLLLWGLIGGVAGKIGVLSPGFGGAVLGLSALGYFRPRLLIPPRLWAMALIAGLLIAVGLIDVFGPLDGADERYLHVGLPLQMLLEHGLLGGPLHPNGSRPLTLQIAYTLVLGIGEVSAAPALHWWLSLATLTLVIQLGRLHFGKLHVGLFAAVVLATSTTFLVSTGQAASDIPTAFGILLAIDAAICGRARQGAIAAALALSIKYTAAAPLFGIWLCAKGGWSTRIKVAAGTIIMVSPWWIRNLIENLHPLFPFTGWPLPQLSFEYPQKYGAGRDLIDFVWLPWRMLFEARPDTRMFLGRLHPLVLLALLPMPMVWKNQRFRPWIVASLIGLIAWSIGPQWLRYLIPSLPLLALTGAAIVVPLAHRTSLKTVLWCALLLGSLSGLQGSRRHFMNQNNAPMQSTQILVKFCHEVLPEDARIAMLFSWASADINRAQILGSLDDHTPTRHFLLRNRGRVVEALIDAGATHAVVRKVNFLRGTYPFVGIHQFRREFTEPAQQLDDALLMGADLLFQSPTHRVYRLTPRP